MARRPVALFARPEACRLVAAGTPGALPARVASVVFQGAHVEVHVDCAGAAGGRAMVRAATRTPLVAGDAVALELPRTPVIFAEEDATCA